MLEIRLPYRPANLFEDAVMTQCPANHGKQPPSLPDILFRTPTQVNAKELLREVHAAEEGVEAGANLLLPLGDLAVDVLEAAG